MTNYFASKADFDRAVQEALKPLQDELNSIKHNRDTILQEKRALEGKTNGVTPEGIIRTSDALHIPRDTARNPQEYQRWRHLAQSEGLSVKVIDGPPQRDNAQLPDKYTTERVHYVNRAYLNGSGERYREERAFAESKGLKIHPFSNASELPTEAFLPKGDA